MANNDLRVRAATADPFPDAAPEGVTEAHVAKLVHGFYGRIRADDLLGPIFSREIAEDEWPDHLRNMCDFWSSVVLRTDRYGGRPLPPHLRLEGLGEPHFRRWLALFRATAEAELPAEAALLFIQRAERIAHSFRLSIAFHRGEDTTGVGFIAAG